MKAEANRCPSAAILELLLAERLGDDELEPIEGHVEECAACQGQLDHMIAKTIPQLVLKGGSPAVEAEPRNDFLRRLKETPLPAAFGSGEALNKSCSNDRLEFDFADRLKKRRLGQYEILETLGSGNMGIVYKATHVELGKLVALKILPASTMDEVNIARFKHEARMASRLDHLNIVATHDLGQAEGIHFLVMAFVDGVDLAKIVARHGKFSVADACEVVRQAAMGLQHAFERGLVHRDIKPSNLILTRDGVVKVLDFGVARSFADAGASERLTATGILVGTADYLAPEQWENSHATDTRADVYSLGCTLFHLMAGHPPFSGPRYQSILAKMRGHLDSPPPPIIEARPDVPADLAVLLNRMLAKKASDRFATPRELSEALKPYTAGADLVGLSKPIDAAATSITNVSPFVRAADTAHPSGTFATGRRLPARRIGRRYVALLTAASICLALAIVVALWSKAGGSATASPLKIEEMTVRQFRGETATLIGNIAITKDEPIKVDDSVRVSAKLNSPGYFYLLAFNPDGSEQLCYPEDPKLASVLYPKDKTAKSMETAPTKSAELSYPRDKYFEPGIPGLQVLMLIASAEPLPPYAKWRSKFGATPWKKVDQVDPQVRWEFDGREFNRLSERGKVVDRGPAFKEFRELCRFFRDRPGVQAIRAVAFPVTK